MNHGILIVGGYTNNCYRNVIYKTNHNKTSGQPVRVCHAEQLCRQRDDASDNRLLQITSARGVSGTQAPPRQPVPGTERRKVELKVYDVLGREVITLVKEYQEAGVHTAYFNGQNLASGVYFYRLTAPGISLVRKMLMVK